jgi:hypothetical protein
MIGKKLINIVVSRGIANSATARGIHHRGKEIKKGKALLDASGALGNNGKKGIGTWLVPVRRR